MLNFAFILSSLLLIEITPGEHFLFVMPYRDMDRYGSTRQSGVFLWPRDISSLEIRDCDCKVRKYSNLGSAGVG